MPLDPQVEAVLEQFAAAGQAPLEEQSPGAARQVAQLLAVMDGEPEPVDEVVDLVVPGDGVTIPIRVYRPRPGTLPVVMWFHAGGGVIGDLETADRTCRRLANRSGALVVSVDYRRGPEHRFPAAVDDCWTATRWAASSASDLGGCGSRLAVAGDSMGATFAAVVARRAARSGAPRLRHQVLVYPFTDLTLSHPSVDEHASGHLLTKSLCRWFIEHYLEPGGDPRHPDASPLFAEDVSAAAPATVLVAELDPVRDEAIAYAGRLTDAGVPVDLKVYDGMTHVFFALSGLIDRADEAMSDVAGALARALR